jgi:hypothetical protein
MAELAADSLVDVERLVSRHKHGLVEEELRLQVELVELVQITLDRQDHLYKVDLLMETPMAAAVVVVILVVVQGLTKAKQWLAVVVDLDL